MKFVAAALAVCIAAGGAFGIAPPVDPVPPKIVPFSPPQPPQGPPSGGNPNTTPVNTPEPASLTIVGLGLAAAGTYRFLRRRQLP
jgi:hypothetical protein